MQSHFFFLIFFLFLLSPFFSQKEHPSALTAFTGMMTAAMGKQIVIFLDYDGTLAPIVDDPERAFMSDAVTPLHIYDM